MIWLAVACFAALCVLASTASLAGLCALLDIVERALDGGES